MPRSATVVFLSAVLFAPGGLRAAPVPVGPKVDDSVSLFAAKLLEHRKVQKELKMTAEQRIAIVDGLADLGEENEKKVDALLRRPDPTDEQFDKLDAEHKKAVEKLLTDTAAKGLTAAQRKRLGQLEWYVRGVAAFTDPRVAKLLQLTDAQKKKATELAERQKSAVDRYTNNPNDENEAKIRMELFAARKDFQKQMEDALTAEQKTGWAAMLGGAPTALAVDDLWLQIEEDAEPGTGSPVAVREDPAPGEFDAQHSAENIGQCCEFWAWPGRSEELYSVGPLPVDRGAAPARDPLSRYIPQHRPRAT